MSKFRASPLQNKARSSLLRIQDIDNDENEHRNRNRENEILNKIYNEIRMLRIKQEPGAEDEEEEKPDVVVTQPTVKTRERSPSMASRAKPQPQYNGFNTYPM